MGAGESKAGKPGSGQKVKRRNTHFFYVDRCLKITSWIINNVCSTTDGTWGNKIMRGFCGLLVQGCALRDLEKEIMQTLQRYVILDAKRQ